MPFTFQVAIFMERTAHFMPPEPADPSVKRLRREARNARHSLDGGFASVLLGAHALGQS
jgi:hypothetical protein